ncbi:hypothetical protein LCGC14_1213670 [marine sediment metagenome]|uniref:Uncharacterized protein n=1 Tax=marine sediment metagenome TaxID=412755 RepID=A0A0F9PHY5_9ZZZZ
MAIGWLEALMENEHITVEHALNGGEFKIPTTNYRADGYCKETNTVYEFYGDAFHGNPKIFGRSDRCHPYNRKVTAQTLLARARRRAERIRSLGFNLVEMWESDWTL